MSDLTELSATAAALAFREGATTPSELTDALLDKIAREDGEVNALRDTHVEAARAAALEADKRYLDGTPIGTLDGISIVVKDNILVEGHFATAGSKILEGYVASYDATIVDRLKKTGAIILGKTNMDEFAMGSSTEHSAFGPTKNPLDAERVPGGSSGGSAAAVAQGFAPLALGTDTGGSIRQPAAFCGVVGMKPTYGRVSRSGLVAMASSLDQAGPLARTVEDAELVFEAIEGKDVHDATTHQDRQDRVTEVDIQKLRVGVPKEYFTEGLDPRIKEAVEKAVQVLENKGASIKEVSLPHSPHALAVYYIIMPSEASANLARYDGIRYGASTLRSSELAGSDPAGAGSAWPSDFWNVYFETRQQFFGDEVKRRIMLGTFTLSSGYYDAFYVKAQKVRSRIKDDFDAVFEEVDVLVTPTAPTLPFKLGDKTEDPLSMYLADIYTVSANLTGIPGISVPFGLIEEGGKTFPAGVQLLGPAFSDERLFSIAKSIESADSRG